MWGEFRLARAEAKPRRLLVQSRTPKKSFVFLLEKKIGRAQIRKCEENFFAGWRALASGGGAVQSFRSKWVRAKFRIEHQIKNSPPKAESFANRKALAENVAVGFVCPLFGGLFAVFYLLDYFLIKLGLDSYFIFRGG